MALLGFVEIGADADIASIYILVRFYVTGATKSLYILRFARNLAKRTELSLERCVLHFMKIGSDLDIAPVYNFDGVYENAAPKSLYNFRFERNFA